MKLLAVHTCPLWEDEDGERRPGMDPEDDQPPVVGWCNVGIIELNGRSYRFLLARQVPA